MRGAAGALLARLALAAALAASPVALPVAAQDGRAATERAPERAPEPAFGPAFGPAAAALAAHAGFGERALHVGAAASIDLREGHYGGRARYAIDADGPPLPAGLRLAGWRIVGVPEREGAARPIVVARRPETGETVRFAAPLRVLPPDLGVFARAEPVRAPAGGALTPAGASFGPGAWRFAFSGDDGPRHGALALTVEPGRTYRLTAQATLDGAVDGPVTLRVSHEDGDPGRRDPFDDWTTYIAEDDHPGEAGPAWLDVTFTPGRPTVFLQLGAVWRGPKEWTRTDLAGRTATLSHVRVAPLADVVAPGGAVVTDRFHRFGATVTLDRPRLVGRYVTGDYWVLNDDPQGDPLTILALGPVGGGAQLNVGATDARYGLDAQGFDPRAGLKGRPLQVRYDPALDVDPWRRGRPLVWSDAGAGAEGSVTKAILEPRRRYIDGGRQSIAELVPVTVVTERPPADAFMPPTSQVAKRHRRVADLGPDWMARLLPDLALPADAPAHDPDALAHFMARPPQIGVQNQPRDRNMLARLHERDYGREQSRRWERVLMALLTDPARGGLTPARREALALQAIQFGLALDGRAEAGGLWIANGGGSQNRKPFAVLAALAFRDPAMLDRVDGDRRGRKPYAEDRFIARVAPDIIAPAYAPPDYKPDNTQRPRAPYRPYMLGMPEWRNDGRTGANFWGDGYRGIAMTSSLGGWLFGMTLKGGREAWGRPVGFDYADRHFQWVVNGVRAGEADVEPIVAAMWRAHRAGGAPVAMRRWGLVEDGAVAADDPRDPGAGAVDVPRMRPWAVGAPGALDLAAEEFNARAGLADGAPERFELRGAADADGRPIPAPDWVSVNRAGALRATPPDGALRFLDIAGINASGEAVSRIALQAAAPAPLRAHALTRPPSEPAALRRLTAPFGVAEGDHLLVDVVGDAAALRDATVEGAALRLVAGSPPGDGGLRAWRLVATAPAGGWAAPTVALRFSSPTRLRAVSWGAVWGVYAAEPSSAALTLREPALDGAPVAPDGAAGDALVWALAVRDGRDAPAPEWLAPLRDLGRARWRGGALAAAAGVGAARLTLPEAAGTTTLVLVSAFPRR